MVSLGGRAGGRFSLFSLADDGGRPVPEQTGRTGVRGSACHGCSGSYSRNVRGRMSLGKYLRLCAARSSSPDGCGRSLPGLLDLPLLLQALLYVYRVLREGVPSAKGCPTKVAELSGRLRPDS